MREAGHHSSSGSNGPPARTEPTVLSGSPGADLPLALTNRSVRHRRQRDPGTRKWCWGPRLGGFGDRELGAALPAAFRRARAAHPATTSCTRDAAPAEQGAGSERSRAAYGSVTGGDQQQAAVTAMPCTANGLSIPPRLATSRIRAFGFSVEQPLHSRQP